MIVTARALQPPRPLPHVLTHLRCSGAMSGLVTANVTCPRQRKPFSDP